MKISIFLLLAIVACASTVPMDFNTYLMSQSQGSGSVGNIDASKSCVFGYLLMILAELLRTANPTPSGTGTTGMGTTTGTTSTGTTSTCSATCPSSGKFWHA